MPRKSRNTKQKEILAAEITKIKEFFTAEDLYLLVKKKHPEIGLATVYRFMKEMRKEKTIHAYTCDKKMLYAKNKISHCHFICEETGKIIHFELNSLDFLKDKIPGTITSVQLEVKGVCNTCTKKSSHSHE